MPVEGIATPRLESSNGSDFVTCRSAIDMVAIRWNSKNLQVLNRTTVRSTLPDRTSCHKCGERPVSRRQSIQRGVFVVGLCHVI